MKGFTLLELLVTLVIATIMLGMLYGILVSTMEIQNEVDWLSRQTLLGQRVLNLIASDLAATYAYSINAKEPLLAGNTKKEGENYQATVDFLALRESYRRHPSQEEKRDKTGTGQESQPALVTSPLTRLGYQLKPNEDKPGCFTLYRREVYYGGGTDKDKGKLIKVYDGVTSFRLRYLTGEGNSTKISDQWDNRSAGMLPRAILIELQLDFSRWRDKIKVEPYEETFATHAVLRAGTDK